MALDSTALNFLLILLLVIAFWGFIIWNNTRKMHVQIQQVAHQQSVIRNNDNARALCRAIHMLQPGVHAGVDYVIEEGGPDGKPYLAKWLASTPQPTTRQLQDALEKLSKSRAPDDLADLRKAEYPSVEQQLEAAYEARQGDDTRQKELDARITEIRGKYPKSDDSL